MITRIATRLAAATALLGLSMTSHAVAVPPAIYVLPSAAEIFLSEGSATLELFMDFTGSQTIGGGIDLSLSGPITLVSFTPSAYLNGLNSNPAGDNDFTGFGTANADGDFEIHFGSFGGETGLNKLGDITVDLKGLGLATIGLAINSLYGDFFSTGGSKIDVTLAGASLQVVPVPAAAWLFLSAVGALGGMRLRRAA